MKEIFQQCKVMLKYCSKGLGSLAFTHRHFCRSHG